MMGDCLMVRIPNTVERMLRINVDRSSGDCWIWKSPIGHNGYGKAHIMSRAYLAHRVFYKHYKGDIPEGFQIDHLCKVRNCVNPDHLEAVPPHINNYRSESPCALNRLKDECKHGHLLSGDNLYVTKDGRRQCKTCLRRRWREGQERKLSG
jgi:hypothetical protein